MMLVSIHLDLNANHTNTGDDEHNLLQFSKPLTSWI